MQEKSRIKEAILDLSSGKYNILFVHPEYKNFFENELIKYSKFIESTFLSKVRISSKFKTIVLNNSSKEKNFFLNYIITNEISLKDLYLSLSFLKVNPNYRIIIYDDLNELNYNKLNNLEEFYNVASKINFFNIPTKYKIDLDLSTLTFDKFEDFLYSNNSYFGILGIKPKYKLYSYIKETILNYCYDIKSFKNRFNFICLNENDCVYWHKNICKNVFEIPYTDFNKLYIYNNYKDFTSKVTYQTNNCIYTDEYGIYYPFDRNNSFDTELLNLFNYKNLDNCFIPAYLDILERKLPITSPEKFILMSQIKNFYNKYPEYFDKLINTLLDKCITIVVD